MHMMKKQRNKKENINIFEEVVVIEKIKGKNPIFKIFLILIVIQLARMTIMQILFLFVDKTDLNCDITVMITMCLLTILIVFIAHKQNIILSVIPNANNIKGLIGYICITILLVFLIVSAPFFTMDFSSNIIIPIVFSTIVTPIFEELIFRGYVWNELKRHIGSEFKVYIISTIFFALWHLGYIDIIWFKISLRSEIISLQFAMLMKVITGLCFGIIIGLVRYKTKNCYAAMLMHSIMNVFGR